MKKNAAYVPNHYKRKWKAYISHKELSCAWILQKMRSGLLGSGFRCQAVFKLKCLQGSGLGSREWLHSEWVYFTSFLIEQPQKHRHQLNDRRQLTLVGWGKENVGHVINQTASACRKRGWLLLTGSQLLPTWSFRKDAIILISMPYFLVLRCWLITQISKIAVLANNVCGERKCPVLDSSGHLMIAKLRRCGIGAKHNILAINTNLSHRPCLSKILSWASFHKNWIYSCLLNTSFLVVFSSWPEGKLGKAQIRCLRPPGQGVFDISIAEVF